MLLSELLTAAHVKVPLSSRNKSDVLRELIEVAAGTSSGLDVDAILASVRDREQLLSTGIGDGVAIPHGKTPLVGQLTLVAGVAAHDIDFDALDGRPVRLFFLLLGPESAAGAHVRALSRISTLLRRDHLRTNLLESRDAESFLGVVRASEAP